MSRILTGLLAAVMVVSIEATALAAGPVSGWRGGHGGGHHGGGCGGGYVDVDQDGVCDNRVSYQGICPGCPGGGFVDEDGDGVCDACGSYSGICLDGTGRCFADGDGDGICDACGASHWTGTRQGLEPAAGSGRGICVRHGARWSGRGRGYGRGN